MKAGQLEIELLANVARLQQDMEQVKRSVGDMTTDVGRKARAANDNLRSIGRGAGAGVQAFSRDVAQLKASIDPAWAALERYKQQVNLLRDAQRQGALTQAQYIQQVRAAKAAYQEAGAGVVGASNAQRQGLQQLGYQIGDVSTMFALGARPSQIFASQIGQITQAVQLATGGTSRFAAFLGGPWGVAISVAVMALGPLIGKLFETEDATKKVEFASYGLGDAQSILGGVMDLTTGKITAQSDALWANARAQAAAAQVAARKEQFEASSEMRSIRKGKIELQGGMGGGVRFARVGDPTADIVSAFQGGTLSVTEAERGLRSLMETGLATEGQYLKAAEAVTKFGMAAENIKLFGDLQKGLNGDKGALGQFLTPSNRRPPAAKTDRRAETLQREAEATEALITGLGLLADAYLVSEAAAMKAEVAAKATEQGIKKQADVAEYVARQMRLAVAERIADAAKEVSSLRAQTEAQEKLNARIIQGGYSYEDAVQMMKDQADLRPYLTALAIAEGDAKAKLADVIERLRIEQKRSNDETALSKALQDAHNYERQVIAPLEREAQVLGLVGWQRERALLQMEREADIAPLLAKHTDALARGNYELAAALQVLIDKRIKAFNLQIQMGDWTDADDRAKDRLDLYNDALRETISLLERIGGFGGVLGGILGFVSGNASGLRGPIGDLLNLRTGTKADPRNPNREIATTLADELREIFKLNGQFGQTMANLLQGAGTGMLAANALGFTGKGSQVGSAIGGALGTVAGEAVGKAVRGTLGKALGPLGSIAGGLIGGALGSLLSKTPKGTATIGNVNGSLGVSATAGNSQSRIAAASKSANAIIDSLESIASQLGASIDPSKGSVSIGIRKGSFRVDPTGKGATKVKKGAIDFGEDAEAAAYYAMMDLIKDGVLAGLRAGTERLLRNADDLEAGLAKALKFEGVFKDLASLKNPMQFALDELTREFDQLRKIFGEAGASAAEYAQLEELLSLKREDAIERAQREAIDKISERRELEIRILELLGREQDALAASRELELAGMKASLRPLQSMIYQLEDARQIMERFAPLAADLRFFKQEVLGNRTSNGFAQIAARFREVAALAKGGDATALGNLRGSATEYLDAAKENAKTSLDYRRAVGEVLASVDSGIFAADAQVEYAQMQIDAIAAQSDILVSIKDQLETSQAAIAAATAKTATLLQRFEGDGLTVKTDTDTPLFIRLPTGERLQVEVV